MNDYLWEDPDEMYEAGLLEDDELWDLFLMGEISARELTDYRSRRYRQPINQKPTAGQWVLGVLIFLIWLAVAFIFG